MVCATRSCTYALGFLASPPAAAAAAIDAPPKEHPSAKQKRDSRGRFVAAAGTRTVRSRRRSTTVTRTRIEAEEAPELEASAPYRTHPLLPLNHVRVQNLLGLGFSVCYCLRHIEIGFFI